MFNGPPRMTGNSEGEVPPPPLEVLIKSKWYRATAAVRDNHFGISLDEDQVRFISRLGLRMSSTASSTEHYTFDYFGPNIRLFD